MSTLQIKQRHMEIDFEKDEDGDVLVEVTSLGEEPEVTAFYIFKADLARLIPWLRDEPSGDSGSGGKT